MIQSLKAMESIKFTPICKPGNAGAITSQKQRSHRCDALIQSLQAMESIKFTHSMQTSQCWSDNIAEAAISSLVAL
ncbi:MAG: hypothetical protein DWQ05_16880 [Calditrichaeota bacterium]|nr:MAG: hypothetical protein DWQ05_16870 [Calditrichota bacterium]KAA3613947.1 MAG: hypothetical protein DWQ05_16880 [Calditrichota bacterium]